ncbi:uncharacterized protein LOC116608874 [Nematostella vectensis]|uniref:uncharacterized protein LOC116608874 n=1 Tax=Nematostella vectensis TaxID=45351 RepID=UPI0020775490|nr:uncharacterized protein LOC116608874 [Nematostella vectensis]
MTSNNQSNFPHKGNNSLIVEELKATKIEMSAAFKRIEALEKLMKDMRVDEATPSTSVPVPDLSSCHSCGISLVTGALYCHKCGTEVTSSDIVKINIGLVRIGKNKKLTYKRNTIMPIPINKNSSHLEVTNKGKELLLVHNKDFSQFQEEEWVLLYHDMAKVGCLPGTSEPFTVAGYQKFIGKEFRSITLYICRKVDFEVAETKTTPNIPNA